MLNIKKLSNAFLTEIKLNLTAKQITQVKTLNANETDKRIDHLHDFIDANQLMINAFENVFKTSIDFECSDNLNLINKAWLLSRTQY